MDADMEIEIELVQHGYQRMDLEVRPDSLK